MSLLELGRLEDENARLRDDAIGIRADLRVQHTMNQDLRGINTSLRNEKARLRDRNGELFNENGRLRRAADGETQALRAEEARLRDENADLHNKNNLLRAEVEQLRNIHVKSRSLQRRLDSAIHIARRIQTERDELRRQLARAEDGDAGRAGELQTAQEQLILCRQHRNVLRNYYRTVLAERDTTMEQLGLCQADRDSLQALLDQANSPLDSDIRERTARVLRTVAHDVVEAGK